MRPLINVIEYLLHSLAFSPNTKFEATQAVKGQVQTGFSADRDPTHDRRFSIRLSLRYHADRMPEANFPYALTIMLEGYFECPFVFEGQVPKSVILNALMVLYGVARGVVGQITATAVNGKFLLPALAFDELVNRAETTGTDQTPKPQTTTSSSRKPRRRKKGA